MKDLFEFLDIFRKEGRMKLKLFVFWDFYIEMVELFFIFIRVEWEGNWLLYFVVIKEMIFYFFFMDWVNYFKWFFVYFVDMD